MRSRLNPLDHPICFAQPARIAPSAWTEHVPFAMFLVDVFKPKVIVELGTYYGVSYCAFCQAVKTLGLDTRCYAVDTWKGDEHSGFFGPEVLADLRKHHDPLYGGFSRLIPSTFDEALQHFKDGSIDLLHIDGYHTYEAVKRDFESWLPKVSPNGIILFHDINVRELDFGVWKLWLELKERYRTFEFTHAHGLGILATGKSYPREVEALLAASGEEAVKLREFFYRLGYSVAMQNQVAEREQALEGLRAELSTVSERAAGLEAQLAEREQMLEGLRSELSAVSERAAGLEAQLAEREQMLEGLQAELSVVSERAAGLEAQLAEREQQNTALTLQKAAAQQELDAVKGQYESLQQYQQEREQILQDLNNKLLEIYSSTAWKIIKWMWRVRLFFFPKRSRRERLGHLILHDLWILGHKGIRVFIRPGPQTATTSLSIELKDEHTLIPAKQDVKQPPSQSGKKEIDTYKSLLKKIEFNLHQRPYSLAISHDDYLKITGGVQVVIRHEVEALTKRGVACLHLFPVDSSASLSRKGDDFLVGVNLDNCPVGTTTISNLLQILGAFQKRGIQCCSLQVHHIMGWGLEYVSALKNVCNPAKSFFWVHDFYTACPNYNLLRNDKEFCNLPRETSNACTICQYGINRKANKPFIHSFFERNDFIFLLPSNSALHLWEKEFSSLANKAQVVPLFRLVENKPLMHEKVRGKYPIRIAFIGRSHTIKGWEIWRTIVEKYRAYTEYEFYHLGYLTDNYRNYKFPETYREVLNSLDNPYAMINSLLENQIDIVILCPIWPETFSIATFEATAAGCFILTCKGSGNIADHVQQHGIGIVFQNANELISYMANPRRIKSDLEFFQRNKNSHLAMLYNDDIVDKYYLETLSIETRENN